MGIFSPFSRHSSDNCDRSDYTTGPVFSETSEKRLRKRKDIRNPDSRNFEILRSKRIRNYAVIFIRYPNCTNFEGKKILVFKGVSIKFLKSKNLIDPHFTDRPDELPLVARFRPTERGWSDAIRFCNFA